MTIAIDDAERIPTVRDQPARLSALHATHQALGARFEEHAGWQVPEAYAAPEAEAAAVRERVGVADVSPAGKLVVVGKAARELLTETFGVAPESPGDVAPAVLKDEADLPLGGGHIACLTDDEFLIITPPGTEQRVARRLEQRRAVHELFVTVVDQTSGLAGLLVAGPDSRELLSKLCALSFNPQDFANRTVAQSSLAKVHTAVLRNDLAGVPAFELYFERPYAEYVWDSVMDAGSEFGIMPFGSAAKRLLEKQSAA